MMQHRAAALSVLSLDLGFALFGVRGAFHGLDILLTSGESPTWVTSTAVVALFGAVVSLIYSIRIYILTKRNADRAVIVDAQKLLLEINKLLVAEPNLFAIYDNVASKGLFAANDNLKGKLRAFGFMNLNVFEMVFAQLPRGKEHETWTSYFTDSLRRSTLLCELLKEAGDIYHPSLKKIYEEWKKEEGKGK